ncbi:MAG: MBL fold metallo-hydrolase, partial [Chloroflexota bacterium]|nr:MBL fold metallo-hydrolase [Chloroflexota bacterium]
MPEVELILTGFTSHTDQGRLGFCTVGLIRGDKTILVDTAHHGRRMMLTQALADRSISPNDIDVVVLTHAHWDHVQNVDVFKNAQVAVGADELEYAKDPHPTDWATSGYFLDMLSRRDVLAVTDGQELAPGVRILGTPGHSRG